MAKNFNDVNSELVEVEPAEVTDSGLITGFHGPYRVVGANVCLIGTHNGSVRLFDGASLTLNGIHNGSLKVAAGCTAEVAATHNGSLHITAGGKVCVTGVQNGSVHVERGANFRVERSGRHAGSVHNDGRYELAGERGGTMNGDGVYLEESGSLVRKPTRYIDNSPVYEW